MLARVSQHSFLPSLVKGAALDLGGNRGAFCRDVASRYGWDVVAVEPVPELAHHLKTCGVTVIEAAIAGSDGTATLTYDLGKELTGSLLEGDTVGLVDAHTTEVKTISLASILAMHPADLVKVDIEGAELDMLLSASDETLLAVSQFTIEFHDYWYPELAERTELAKSRLLGLGFWMMRGTPNNKDVLFVHPACVPPLLQRLYIGLWLRNVNGLGRAFLIVCRKMRHLMARSAHVPADGKVAY